MCDQQRKSLHQSGGYTAILMDPLHLLWVPLEESQGTVSEEEQTDGSESDGDDDDDDDDGDGEAIYGTRGHEHHAEESPLLPPSHGSHGPSYLPYYTAGRLASVGNVNDDGDNNGYDKVSYGGSSRWNGSEEQALLPPSHGPSPLAYNHIVLPRSLQRHCSSTMSPSANLDVGQCMTGIQQTNNNVGQSMAVQLLPTGRSFLPQGTFRTPLPSSPVGPPKTNRDLAAREAQTVPTRSRTNSQPTKNKRVRAWAAIFQAPRNWFQKGVRANGTQIWRCPVHGCRKEYTRRHTVGMHFNHPRTGHLNHVFSESENGTEFLMQGSDGDPSALKSWVAIYRNGSSRMYPVSRRHHDGDGDRDGAEGGMSGGGLGSTAMAPGGLCV